MRVMVLVKATEDSEKGFSPTAETMAMMEAMGRFNDELSAAGILLAGDGLKPSSQGKRVAFDGSRRTVHRRTLRPSERTRRRLLALGRQRSG